VVFQSHTYSRTHSFLADFVQALTLADHVYLLPIYPAREENTWGVSSEQIVDALVEQGTTAELYQTPEAIALTLRQTVTDGDVVVVIGAGAVTEVAKHLTE
jgi:UDP-N-acetylmuramate--alanine ligase